MDKLSGSLLGASESRIVATAIVFLLTLITGVVLTGAGRPLNVPVFTVHKLIALAATVLIALTIYALRDGIAGRAVVWAAIVLTGLLLISLFVTGALLSADRPSEDALLLVHRIAPILTPIAAAGTIYLLVTGNRGVR